MENLQLVKTGMKCDNQSCDWHEDDVNINELDKWINSKCPKCGENLLTLEDYNNAMVAIKTAELINLLTPEELKDAFGDIDTAQFRNQLREEGVTGVDLIESGENLIMSVNTHKGVNISGFEKAE